MFVTDRSEVEVELRDLQVLFEFVPLLFPGVLPGPASLLSHHENLLHFVLGDRLRVLQSKLKFLQQLFPI